MMGNDPVEVLVSREEIGQIVSKVAGEINKDYKGKELVVVGVLKGSVIFVSDLVRELTMPLELDFIEVASYVGTQSSGKVKLLRDVALDISGRDVLIVEDMIDTGNTIAALKELLLARKPSSLKMVAFLDKPARRKKKVSVDYVGKMIPDVFVVGYGMDYDGKYRGLPDVRVFEPIVY